MADPDDIPLPSDDDLTAFEAGLLRHAGRRLAAGNGIIDVEWFDSLVMRTIEGARDWRDLSAPQSRFRVVTASQGTM